MSAQVPNAQVPNKGKNVIIGCLVVLGIVVFGGAAVAYFVVGRPALNALNAARNLGRIQELDSRVTNRAGFSAPADGVLTSSQVDRYLVVARQIRDELEGRVSVLQERYDDVNDTGDGFSGLREAAGAWADLLRLVVEAKETQVEALNGQGFSLAEYSWVRRQVLSAAGLPLLHVDLAALVNDGANVSVQRQEEPAPQANLALVAPHAGEVEEFAPLAIFGL